MVKEFYQHRQDKLYSRIHNHRTGWVTELFYEGRSHCLKGEFPMMLWVPKGHAFVAVLCCQNVPDRYLSSFSPSPVVQEVAVGVGGVGSGCPEVRVL